MGYILSNDSLVLKYDTVALASPSNPSPPTPTAPTPLDSKRLKDLLSKVFGMDEKFKALQDLFLLSHYKFDSIVDSIEKIWATMKEIGTDIAKIRLKLEQVIKDAAKFAQKIKPVQMNYQPL